MDLAEINCACGNPECQGKMFARKGYVRIPREDGSEEKRWDYFHLLVSQQGKSHRIELMAPPEEARRFMWKMIAAYMPGVRHLVNSCQWVRCQLSI